MAPVPLMSDCREGVHQTATPLASNQTDSSDTGVDHDDLSALLYIVVTLLFYSMGIVVGIITYLKRERADMEEEKVFDMYLAMKRDPFNVYRQERVKQMARRLHKMERAKADRLERERLAATSANYDSGSSDAEGGGGHSCGGDSRKCKQVKISDCVPKRSPSTKSFSKDSGGADSEGTVLVPLVLCTANMMVGSTSLTTPLLRLSPPPSSSNLQPPVSTHGTEHERRFALPTKGGEHERRRALSKGPSGLQVREPGRTDTALLICGPVVNQPSGVLS